MGADARAPRRMQRRDRHGMTARRLMNNREVGSKPMSMKRFPYIPAARRAVVNATADGKNATFFGKNETDDGGRGNSTDGGDKIEEALWNVYESFVGLYGSFWSLENLELVCTTDLDLEYKRDEYDEYVENLFVNQMNEAADAGKKLKEKVDGLAYLYIMFNCDKKVFCKNVKAYQEEYALQEVYEYFCEQ